MKLTYMQRLEAALKYKSGEGTYEQIYGIKLSSLQEIVSKYESLGNEGLKDEGKYMNYSDELKTRAVEDYLSGGTSLLEICRKYKIRSKTAHQGRQRVCVGGRTYGERNARREPLQSNYNPQR